MAARSPWSLNDPKQIAQLGAQALQSGRVSPNQAAANFKLMVGADPEDDNPFSMNAPSDLYGDVSGIGNTKGAKAEVKRQMDMKKTSSTTRYTSKAPDQSRYEMLASQGIYPNQTGSDAQGNPTYDFENLPEPDAAHPYQEQKAGIDRMKELLAIQAKSDTSWLQPLAALADSQGAANGRPSNLAASFQKPADQQAGFIKEAGEIQKRQQDLSKDAIANQKLLKGGSTTEGLTQSLMAAMMAGQNNQVQDRQGMQDDRIHDRVLARLASNPNLKAKIGQYQNLQGALANLAQADVKNPNSFEELQQTVRSNLGIKGTSGVTERDKTYLNSLGLSADRMNQILFGKPKEMGASGQAFMKHVVQLANIELNNVRQQYNRSLHAATLGHGSMYARRQDLKDDLDEAVRGYSGQLNDYEPLKKETPPPAPASSLPSATDIDAELAKRTPAKGK